MLLSASVKVRPATSRVRIVSKYPGSTPWKFAWRNVLGSVTAASVPQRPAISRPSSGSGVAAVTPCTPGIAFTRARTSCLNAARCAACSCCAGRRNVKRLRGIVARVDAPQRHDAAKHQPGADQQDERQGNLRHHDAAAQRAAAAEAA